MAIILLYNVYFLLFAGYWTLKFANFLKSVIYPTLPINININVRIPHLTPPRYIIALFDHPYYFFAIGSIPVINLLLFQHMFGNYHLKFDLFCLILWSIKFLFYPQKRHKYKWIFCILSYAICILFLFITFIINIIFDTHTFIINALIVFDPLLLIFLLERALIRIGYYNSIGYEIIALYKYLKLNHDDECYMCSCTWKETHNMNIMLLKCGHECHSLCWNEWARDKENVLCGKCEYEPEHIYLWKLHKYQRVILKFITDYHVTFIKSKCIFICKKIIQIVKLLFSTLYFVCIVCGYICMQYTYKIINYKWILLKMYDVLMICINKIKNQSSNSVPMQQEIEPSCDQNNDINNDANDDAVMDLALQQQMEHSSDHNNDNNQIKVMKQKKHKKKKKKLKKKKKRRKGNVESELNNEIYDEGNILTDSDNDVIQYGIFDEPLSLLYNEINEIELKNDHESDEYYSEESNDSLSNLSELSNYKACIKCTFHNAVNAKTCVMCDNLFIDINMNKKKKKKKRCRFKYWTCDICTMRNRNMILQCECGAQKPVKECEWNCNICTTTNHVNNIRCGACKQKRVIDNNQWQCIACYKYNSVNNSICNRCQKPPMSVNEFYKNKKENKKIKQENVLNNEPNVSQYEIKEDVSKPLYLCHQNIPPPPNRAPPAVPKQCDYDIYNKYMNNYQRESIWTHVNSDNEYELDEKCYNSEKRNDYNKSQMDCIEFRTKDIVYFKGKKCQIVHINKECEPYMYVIKHLDNGHCETTKAIYFSIQKPKT